MSDQDLKTIKDVKSLSHKWFYSLTPQLQYDYCNKTFNHGNVEYLNDNEILAIFAIEAI